MGTPTKAAMVAGGASGAARPVLPVSDVAKPKVDSPPRRFGTTPGSITLIRYRAGRQRHPAAGRAAAVSLATIPRSPTESPSEGVAYSSSVKRRDGAQHGDQKNVRNGALFDERHAFSWG